MKDTGRKAVEELYCIKEDPKMREKPEEMAKSLGKKAFYHRNKIRYIIHREKEAVSSVKRLGGNTSLDNFIHKFTEDISVTGVKEITRIDEVFSYIAETMELSIFDQIEETEAEEESKKLVPERLFKGSLSMETVRKALTEKEYEWYEEKRKKDTAFGMKMVEVLNFMDGKRTLYEIIMAVSAEYTETKAEDVLRFLRYLERMKLISL